MRNTLIALLLTAGIISAAAKPKWQNKKLWLYELQKGFPENRVKSILGRPRFVITNSSQKKWYYQVIPRAVPFAPHTRPQPNIPCHTKLLLPDAAGFISWRPVSRPRRGSRPQRPARWVVNTWVQPTWDSLPPAPPTVKPQKNLKPPRRLHRWERVASWKTLMVGLPLPAIQRKLGEPTYERRDHNQTDRIAWYFGNVSRCGVLKFDKGLLKSWTEPFWPEVDRNIYGPPKPTPSPPAAEAKK